MKVYVVEECNESYNTWYELVTMTTDKELAIKTANEYFKRCRVSMWDAEKGIQMGILLETY